jgi:5,10-methylenetetrahydromethanopterin reductase
MPADRKVEFWTGTSGAQPDDPFALVRVAQRLEADGWDGATVVDTHCIAVEAFTCLGLVAQATSRLKLATGVSNPTTRHPSVVASGAATVQAISGGRFVLGLGRGDSALAYLGASPTPVAEFERRVAMLQAYLRGELTPLEAAAGALSGADPGYEKLAIGARLPGSWLKWLPEQQGKVPLEIVATGPKVIDIGVRLADYVTFAVGADLKRLRWAIETARASAERCGRDPAALRFGAFLNLHTHTDLAKSRELAQPGVAVAARFQVMNKTIVGPADDHQREVFQKVGDAYDMTHHGVGGTQANLIDDEFLDAFALTGPPARNAERLAQIIDLGIERLWLGTALARSPLGEESYRMSVEEVLPAVRRSISQ